MSKKYQLVCDKCGSIISNRITRTVNIKDESAKLMFWDVGMSRGENIANRIDLCPECAERFVNWLESGEEE